MTENTQNLPVVAHKAELTTGAPVAAIIPRTIDEVARVAKAVLTAGLMPSSYEGKNESETVSKVIIGIMKGAEVGLPPITALSTICIINNRPSIWGDGAIALIQSKNKLEWQRQEYEGEPHSDNWTAHFYAKRVNQTEPYHGKFSWADAKRARLIGKGPWQAYPERMLMMRARAFALRDGFADCLSGLAIAEEMRDLPPPPPEISETSFLDDDPAPIKLEVRAPIEIGRQDARDGKPCDPSIFQNDTDQAQYVLGFNEALEEQEAA